MVVVNLDPNAIYSGKRHLPCLEFFAHLERDYIRSFKEKCFNCPYYRQRVLKFKAFALQ
jgi:hypothetical protein